VSTKHRHEAGAWPFPVTDETTVLVAPTVLRYRDPVLSVRHDHEGDWLFSDGISGLPVHEEPTCLGCLVASDASPATVADLPRGWLAFRTAQGLDWERMPLPPPPEPVPFFDI
jgi:hypothetical protein